MSMRVQTYAKGLGPSQKNSNTANCLTCHEQIVVQSICCAPQVAGFAMTTNMQQQMGALCEQADEVFPMLCSLQDNIVGGFAKVMDKSDCIQAG